MAPDSMPRARRRPRARHGPVRVAISPCDGERRGRCQRHRTNDPAPGIKDELQPVGLSKPVRNYDALTLPTYSCTKRDVDGVTVMGYTSLPDPFMIFVNTEDDVVISEELELSAIMDKVRARLPVSREELAEVRRDQETSSQSTSSRYELASAVFYRRGDEHAGGHYICYATPASTLGKHCLFDDTYVRLGENWQARTKDFKPYILFYVCKHRPVPVSPHVSDTFRPRD